MVVARLIAPLCNAAGKRPAATGRIALSIEDCASIVCIQPQYLVWQIWQWRVVGPVHRSGYINDEQNVRRYAFGSEINFRVVSGGYIYRKAAKGYRSESVRFYQPQKADEFRPRIQLICPHP